MSGMKSMKVPRGTNRAKRRENMAAFRNWRNIQTFKTRAETKAGWHNSPKVR
jgi:hypothetical protein